jgi:membrane protease YdiL (CAAX protease family)
MLLTVGVMAVFGAIRVDSRLLNKPLQWLGVAATLLFFLVQGPAEEVVFRGYLLPVLSARGTIVTGVVVSSILFGLLHSLNPNMGILPLVNITLAGVMFALYALVEEGLWGVFGLHSAWNWVQGNVLGLAVSGSTLGPSLIRLQEAGPDWLTGGAFGPEGSLFVTLLLTALSIGLGWQLWRKGQPDPAAETH